MNDLTFFISTVILVACGISLLIPFMYVMFIMRQKTGTWYVNKVKQLNREDQSTFVSWNMLYPWLIFVLFLLLIVVYIVIHPSFFGSSWLFILIVGAMITPVLFQIFQFVWLYYRTKKK